MKVKVQYSLKVSEWPEYGKLSRKNIDELQHGTRIKTDSAKKDPRDFAVWRAGGPGYKMRWNSPWGKGFPGWHAECTVMAAKYPGLPFDIHGDGLENIFPHNESEVAQCEAAYGCKFAHYWVLNNMVTANGTKMGKSFGNHTTIKDALKRHTPMTLRFFILNSHYRSNTDFSTQALDGAARGYAKLHTELKRLSELHQDDIHNRQPDPAIMELQTFTKKRFYAAMDDNLNTPTAIACLFEFNREVNKLLDKGNIAGQKDIQAVKKIYNSLGLDILGLFADQSIHSTDNQKITDNLIKLLIELRGKAREAQNRDQSNYIRDRLSANGIFLEDRGDGSTGWKQKVYYKKSTPYTRNL